MISIDCSELSADEKLALASSISDALAGVALALIRGESIVFDFALRCIGCGVCAITASAPVIAYDSEVRRE